MRSRPDKRSFKGTKQPNRDGSIWNKVSLMRQREGFVLLVQILLAGQLVKPEKSMPKPIESHSLSSLLYAEVFEQIFNGRRLADPFCLARAYHV